MTPEFVVVGHLAQDAQPDGTLRLGGTVTYAALLATRLGLRVGVVTSAPAADVAALADLVPDATIVAIPAATPTTFENRYIRKQRRQVLRALASLITPDAIPDGWCAAPIVLLGPIANEIAPEVAARFAGNIRAATPQGWLRRWDERGHVTHTPWRDADRVLPHLTALILSREDLAVAAGADDVKETIAGWAARVPLVALTDGKRRAQLWWDGGPPIHIPAYPVKEVDPTGAGDCFATAFLVMLHNTDDPLISMRYAHAAASFVVEAPGVAGVPYAEQIRQRMINRLLD